MNDFTCHKVVESGRDMHVSQPILIKCFALSLPTNLYSLQTVNLYLYSSFGDVKNKHTFNRQSFFGLRAHLDNEVI